MPQDPPGSFRGREVRPSTCPAALNGAAASVRPSTCPAAPTGAAGQRKTRVPLYKSPHQTFNFQHSKSIVIQGLARRLNECCPPSHNWENKRDDLRAATGASDTLAQLDMRASLFSGGPPTDFSTNLIAVQRTYWQRNVDHLCSSVVAAACAQIQVQHVCRLGRSVARTRGLCAGQLLAGTRVTKRRNHIGESSKVDSNAARSFLDPVPFIKHAHAQELRLVNRHRSQLVHDRRILQQEEKCASGPLAALRHCCSLPLLETLGSFKLAYSQTLYVIYDSCIYSCQLAILCCHASSHRLSFALSIHSSGAQELWFMSKNFPNRAGREP